MNSRIPRTAVCVASALVLFLTGCGSVGPQPRFRTTVVWDQQPTLSDKQNAVWLGYVLARATYIGEHQSHYADVNGPCTPRFDEEVNARFRAARIYRDLAADDKAFRDAYFDDLLAVDKAGFAREYVWTYLHQTSWPETKKPSKLGAFDGWRQTHLASHQVQTYGSIKITPN